jgi:hypothetical protein
MCLQQALTICGTCGLSEDMYGKASINKFPWRDVDKDRASTKLEFVVFLLQSDSDRESELAAHWNRYREIQYK